MGIATAPITANYSGGYYSVTAAVGQLSTSFSLTNLFLGQRIIFGPIPNQAAGISLSLNATATSALPVSYASSTLSVCTISGSTATLLAPGLCTITASQAGNNTYAPAVPVTQSFSVLSLTDPVLSAPTIFSSFYTITLTYTATTGGGFSQTAPVTVFTDGVPNFAHGDFSLGANGCVGYIATGGTCSVTVDFNPVYAGLRTSAVELTGYDGKLVSTAYISGIGNGSQLTFAGANPKTLLGGSPSGIAVDGAGNVFSVDSVTGAVKEVLPNGTSKTLSFTDQRRTFILAGSLGIGRRCRRESLHRRYREQTHPGTAVRRHHRQSALDYGVVVSDGLDP